MSTAMDAVSKVELDGDSWTKYVQATARAQQSLQSQRDDLLQLFYGTEKKALKKMTKKQLRKRLREAYSAITQAHRVLEWHA